MTEPMKPPARRTGRTLAGAKKATPPHPPRPPSSPPSSTPPNRPPPGRRPSPCQRAAGAARTFRRSRRGIGTGPDRDGARSGGALHPADR